MRLLVCDPTGAATRNPTIGAFVRHMADIDVGVDFLMPRGAAKLEGNGVKCTGLEMSRLQSKLAWVLNDKFPWPNASRLQWALDARTMAGAQYARVLGVDRLGLMQASAVAHVLSIPVTYLSFEMTFACETSARYQRRESECLEAIDSWVTQDVQREAAFRSEHPHVTAPVGLVPVASEGPPCPAEWRVRDVIDVPQHAKLALLMGSLADWTMAPEILSSVKFWPSEWHLMVHERFGASRDLLSSLGLGESGSRIHASAEAIENMEGMSSLLAGVDAGLAFYSPKRGRPLLGRNLKVLGRASGKIATFARHSVPIICNEIGLAASDIRTWQAGKVVSGPSEIGETLSSLGAGGSDLRLGASEYFFSVLDYRLYRERIETLMGF